MIKYLDTFVIKVSFGGLGDHLFYSHLPKIAKRAGFRRVLLSNQSAFRKPEYRKLVWELNPYLDGFTDDDADYPLFNTLSSGCNLLDEIMLRRGLDDGRRCHEPEIYYKPNIIKEWQHLTIFDPNFITLVGEVANERMQNFLKTTGWPDAQIQFFGRGHLISCERTIETPTVFDYCDLIHSCTRFVCLTSGGAPLAASIGKTATVLHGKGHPTMFLHSRYHHYTYVGPLETRFKVTISTIGTVKSFGRIVRNGIFGR